MAAQKTFYAISTLSSDVPTLQALMQVACTKTAVVLKVGELLQEIEPRDMYQMPPDVTHGIMYGMNPDKLTIMWNKAVKRQAINALNSLTPYIVKREETPASESEGKPAQSAPQAQQKPSPHLTPKENVTSTSSDDDFTYPHAITLSIDELESLLTRWMAATFPAGSNAYPSIANGFYGESTSWAICLNDLAEIDRKHLSQVLNEFDAKKEIAPDHEWPQSNDGAPWSLALTASICNKLVEKAILEHITPPFPYGIERSFSLGDEIVFISPDV